MIVFISGGARSGKSRFAEAMTCDCYDESRRQGSGGKLIYVATARHTDLEMTERINRHRHERDEAWQTVEEPLDLLATVMTAGDGDVILIDCLTVWLNNRLFASNWNGENALLHELSEIMSQVDMKKLQLIFVSNDVNEGIPVDNELVTSYIATLERVHRFVVSQADHVYQVVAGIPIQWKGEGT
ncbi:bifunctional adenosylcobinamide kinase/adenosylcobinamide-phosphate guanylyltransferase [Salipaludibacillus agaradhaerens]|uniref:Adenosylcobinamide kinase n=1 Tax=Salipaludibacillus agaradhaerens TaxID=76935 RepID=A0A9Q4G020_SALAG|nr:bifunctional adenosylcobinamide kinase/adenosylcobinamide-phosphate guanylyltransferase [Salipaludibacillus agaradhaerens]MCR6097413.1 bifunctional adenosylcobinamide kinase/adenosylcobinamide-phosphate guanylyltransferase [Salipaludibacillus agaradhaerens]MCR6113103.1 bifunctional adenosylcobinamide kinase/adenosylcobinamide-phosphate guanylyltransferase [Salipaludibacillus agaradhaerens]